MSKIIENAKNRFKARIRAKIETKTINGTFKSIRTFYCNGIIFGKTKCYFFGKNGKRYQFLNSSIVSVDKSTGLKDKNNKLIYEGDIVRAFYTTPQGIHIEKFCEVEFRRCAFWVRDRIGAFYLDNENCIYEVIGNIYENEELLND